MIDVDKSVAIIVEKMKKLRESKKMSQLELSLASGVSQTMISQIESRQRTPTLATFLKLCDALEVSPEIIIGNALKDDEERRRDKEKALDIIQIIEKWL